MFDKLINETVAEFKGRPVSIGRVVAIPTDPVCRECIGFEGESNEITLAELDGIVFKWPSAEVFDVNHVKDACLQKRNVMGIVATFN